DGFAYYLEAYDNNDNGPARSGAPELPNSVVIEEPPPPPKATIALTAASQNEQQLQQKNRQLEEELSRRALPQPEQKPQEASHVLRWVMVGSAAAAVGTSVGLHVHANGLVPSLTVPDSPGNHRDPPQHDNHEQH